MSDMFWNGLIVFFALVLVAGFAVLGFVLAEKARQEDLKKSKGKLEPKGPHRCVGSGASKTTHSAGPFSIANRGCL